MLIAAGVLTWWGLQQADSGPGWLEVDGPRYVESGQFLHIRVRLAPLGTSQFLTADLHWARTHDRSEGYLSTGGAKEVGRDGGSYDYLIPVPPRPGLRFARAVVYLSRTGDWNTHSRVAGSDFIEVLTNGLSNSQMGVVPLRMTYERAPVRFHARVYDAPRYLTGLLLLVAAVVAWRRFAGVATPGVAGGTNWLKLVGAFGAAALWELFGLEGPVDDFVRRVAHQEDWYYLRGGVQEVAISVIVAIALLLAWRVVRGCARHQLVEGSLLLYVALSAVNLVSLHSIDQLANLSWHGVTLIQSLKLACAAVLAVAALRIRPASP